MDNSSAKELLIAIETLNGGQFGTTMIDNTDLEIASNNAQNISNAYSGVNSRVSEGWSKAAAVCTKINEKIKNELASLAAHMSQFSEDTISAEVEAAEAVDTANDTADDILAMLDGNNEETSQEPQTDFAIQLS